MNTSGIDCGVAHLPSERGYTALCVNAAAHISRLRLKIARSMLSCFLITHPVYRVFNRLNFFFLNRIKYLFTNLY